MDIVDTFNHLIPSDQLDESLIIGQNLECEGSNEFGPGIQLEDSLKNMLSDKDPMLGSASSQFNLLENEDTAFPIAASTDLDASEPTGVSKEASVTEAGRRPVGRRRKGPRITEHENSSGPVSVNTRSNTAVRGRPGRKPLSRLQKSFLIVKGVKGTQLKKELTLGGRVNVNDLDGGSWLNPLVVLRRLTVTIGGFKIELLPGPSYTQNVETDKSAYCDEGLLYSADTTVAALAGGAGSVQNPTPENTEKMEVTENACAEDASLGLGPYVNPNDVQSANGTLTGSVSSQEEKPGSQTVSEEKPGGKKSEVNQPQSNEIDGKSVSDKTDDKGKQQAVLKSPLKSKQGVSPLKKKEKNDVVSVKPNHTVTGQEASQNLPSTAGQRGEEQQKMRPLKEKKDTAYLKRPAENVQNEHTTKIQKMQVPGDGKEKPKVQPTPNFPVKKSPSGNRVGQHGSAKHNPPPSGAKVDPAHQGLNHPVHSLKATDEGGPEKHKVKKPEKILQKQKNKSSRSISVDEPQLFIPDNAPVVKKETQEEQPATTETVWDGNNCCGLCKKHHNNMFMVGCGRCDDWFHGDCVGLDLAKVREMEEEDQMYVCLKCCEEESKKVEPEAPNAAKPEAQTKTDVQHHKPPPKPQPGPSQTLTPAGVRPVRKDQDRRQSTDVKEGTHKTVIQQKQETKSKPPSSATKKPVSVEAIRRSVRDSLKEILIQRLKESNLSISVEKASDVAKKIERELFHLNKDTDNKYKNKYRSLMFNLKDTKNNVLYKKVLKGEISPGNLIRMSPEELASKELAAWRKRENRHTIEMIEKEQREAERRPITKITHKGEIEIESQEPMKAHEPPEPEPPTAVTEVSVEPPESPEKKPEKAKMEKDTTSQHKSHLFDLHCKICTGRMPPPVEEASTKVVKVATTVVKRQPTKVEEAKSTATPSVEDELHLSVLEESFRSAQSGSEGGFDHIAGRDEEAAYLSGLKTLWRGLIHMHAVAKLVTKAFPVSGVMDNLNEDLPDSIHVGGRISPQIVWDYLEKIRATGTKEVCLIRFSPETEEDEISYTLLYAYFSSRKRFGVVSNNLKQVKDMYLIPLGAIEKVPHQLVPFDGPGLESNRPNLLLGLIIRQRPKRDFLSMDLTEPKRVIPEPKPIPVVTKETRTVEEQKRYLTSLIVAHDKEKDKQLSTAEAVEEPIAETFEEPPAAESSSQESLKPLRFLPGVLVGKGGDLQLLPDVGGKSVAADDGPKFQQDPETEPLDGSTKSPTAAAPRFVIKKKEAKPVKAEQEATGPTDTQTNQPPEKESAVMTRGAAVTPVSLKDKPPDVSTETFLEGFSVAQSGPESSDVSSSNKGAAVHQPQPEKGPSEESPVSQTAPPHTNSSKPPLSGILKKSSSYCSADEDNTTVLQKDKASPPVTVRSQPGPGGSSARSDAITTFHQGLLQISLARNQQQEDNKGSAREKDLPVTSPTHPPVSVHVHSADRPQQTSDSEACDAQHDSAAAAQPQQPQVLGSSDQTQPDDSDSDQPGKPPSVVRHYKQEEELYHDPWERPRNTEDKDHYGRHGHHRDSYHGKKSRHHDREREKYDRSHDDKHREKGRHHGHSDERHGEKRKERQHSDDHSRHKDRHRHRRDSDYENGRRRDSYS